MTIDPNRKRRLLSRAQAATELAVFGTILIFMMGAIVRSALNAGQTQNENLRAMRYALLASWNTGATGSKARDQATVLYIEDRLSADVNRYGSSDRTPLFAQGTGTMSVNIFQALDFGEYGSLPVMDVVVNGQHFILSTANFTHYSLRDRAGVRDITLQPEATAPLVPIANPDEWIPSCLVVNCTLNPTQYYCKQFALGTLPASMCSAATVAGVTTVTCGCRLLYSTVPTNFDNFCCPNCPTCDSQCAMQPPCSRKCGSSDSTYECEELRTAAQMTKRYDLNRNGNYTDDPSTAAQRRRMLWQWSAVRALPGNVKIDTENGNYDTFDVDGDRKEETVYSVNAPGGIIEDLWVIDNQKGDIDLTLDDMDNEKNPAPPVGLQRDIEIFTQTSQGHVMEVKEGKIFNPETKRFVRNFNRRDQIDYVQRMFRISNDTGRLCGTVNGFGAPIPGPLPNNVTNPAVEACACPAGGGCLYPTCFEADTIAVNCFDKAKKILYIRSRVQDLRGREWITQIE